MLGLAFWLRMHQLLRMDPEDFWVILVNFIIFALSLNIILLSLAWLYRWRKKLIFPHKDNVVVGLGNLYYLLLTGAAIITMFGFLGIDYVTLFTSISIVAAAIAIVSKDYISEIISGMIITFSREIAIEDYVKIGDHKGRIIDLNMTKVVLLNEDDDIIYLPNNKVFTSEVVNYTKREIRTVSIDFEISLKHLHTIEELESKLVNTLSDYHAHIEPNSYYLRVVDIKKDSLTLKLQYVLQRRDRELERQIRKKTVRRIVNYVRAGLHDVVGEA